MNRILKKITRPALLLAAALALATPVAAAPPSDSVGGPLAWLAEAWSTALQWIAQSTGTPTGPSEGATTASPAPPGDSADADGGAQVDPDG